MRLMVHRVCRVLLCACLAGSVACGPGGSDKEVVPGELPDDQAEGVLPGDTDVVTPVEVEVFDTGGDGVQIEALEDTTPVPPGGFSPVKLAPSGRLSGVWGSGGTLFAVGEKGAVIRRQGNSWSPMQTPTAKNLHCIYGFGTADVYAAGEDGVILHYDGQEWAKVETGLDPLPGVGLNGAWGEDGHLYLVGDKGTILHLAGNEWKKEESLSTYNLQSIWGESLLDIHVGAAGGTVLRKIGGGWSSEQVTLGSASLYAMHGLDTHHLFAGGTNGVLVVHKGAKWEPETSNDAYERTVRGAWAFAEDDVWFVGEKGVLIHSEKNKDKVKWMSFAAAGPYYKNHSFYGMWGQSGDPGLAWAVGEKGAILQFDGKEWKDQASAPVEDITDMAGTAWEDAVAVGGDGLILRFDGERWVGLDRVTDKPLSAVAPWKEGYLAVGKQGTVVDVSAGKATVVASGLTANLTGLCSGDGGLAAVGEQGKLFTSKNGEGWTSVSTGVFDTLRDCAIDESGEVLAVGDMGRVIRVTAGKAEIVPVATLANLYRIDAAPDGKLYAVGDNGLILEQEGTEWTRVHEEPGLFLYGVAAFEDAVVAVGWAGRILVMDVATGKVTQPPGEISGVLLQVWGPDADHLVVSGKKGALLSYVAKTSEK
ncbi:MAG: hypothetical protein FJ109_04705 [Deltaproteobacteria bacterium]|nr:hypothetical protein [Deltaproteobacteria bacterium]